MVPIPGTSSPKRLEENAGAVQIELTTQEMDRIEAIVPKGVAAGSRYNAAMADRMTCVMDDIETA